MPRTTTVHGISATVSSTTSPTATSFDGFARTSLTCTRPPLTASVAALRVLKNLAAHSHLSIRTRSNAPRSLQKPPPPARRVPRDRRAGPESHPFGANDYRRGDRCEWRSLPSTRSESRLPPSQAPTERRTGRNLTPAAAAQGAMALALLALIAAFVAGALDRADGSVALWLPVVVSATAAGCCAVRALTVAGRPGSMGGLRRGDRHLDAGLAVRGDCVCAAWRPRRRRPSPTRATSPSTLSRTSAWCSSCAAG